ncbi:monoglyceride lipase-like [Tropilaelaps mercedesae]|uniref:Monoglyceride lipase-like n=1 Tax=Tropilaelaps mercedesae TaxID=418985 RepID=A0A1V9XEI8_9ACAR|nr:monoglyceride lipase-like [Tropilaelaps mercedesae]
MLQIKQYIMRIMRPILPNWLPVTTLLFEDCVTETTVAEEFNRDPLRFHGWLQMGMVTALMDAVDDIHGSASSFETPLFIAHGSADRLCCAKASKKFVEDAPAKFKACKIYENGAHCLLHEFKSKIRDRMLEDLFQWLDTRFKDLESLATAK